MLEQQIAIIKETLRENLAKVESLQELDDLRIKFLGRKSEFTAILKSLKDMTDEKRKIIGQLANATKIEIEDALMQTERILKEKSFDFAVEKIDVTMPAQKLERGHLHPLTIIQNEIEDIFTSMGFEIADGREVEDEFHNFDALNMPKDHPARDMQDTFWLKSENEKERITLRTHTSNVQVRYMETHTPPFRIIAPGRIFRNEATDATHEHTFHQFEALFVDENINVGNFKFIAQEFFSKFFKKDVKVRIRPSYFPFTEPSFEFDISCTMCGGKGCTGCKNAGWLEIGGAGMVNQFVFESAGYKRNQYQGFAWGFGIERLAMMKYKINDIRLFHGGDLRFLRQF